MNVITFDIEEWFLERTVYGSRKAKYVEYDRLLEHILQKLEERNLKATFFCVGGMAELYPEVVRIIHQKGHEIGCHSNAHTWLNTMTYDECLDDTRVAVDKVEQCIGEKVLSYRAPAFSIGAENSWVFEILNRCGIERDSSVFPAARDFGGFPDFGHSTPTLVKYKGFEIKEFPISITTFMGKKLAYSGGGYFRLFPLWYIKQQISKYDYNMSYFHIADLMPKESSMMSKNDYEAYYKEKGTILNRSKRYVKENIGRNGALNKMFSLIDNTNFVNLENACGQIDWQSNVYNIN